MFRYAYQFKHRLGIKAVICRQKLRARRPILYTLSPENSEGIPIFIGPLGLSGIAGSLQPCVPIIRCCFACSADRQ